RNRRYGTPGNLAEDIERYMRHEAILARPPSTTYRLRKFAQRNRAAVVTMGTVAAALVVGTGIASWQAIRATRAEAEAVVALHDTQQARAGEAAERHGAEQQEVEARENEQKARAAEAAAKESDATATAVLEFVKKNVFGAASPSGGRDSGGLGKDVTL